jgi:minichromosome maintenance protein 10
MTTTPHGRKPAFDPDRKWGLMPSADKASGSNAEGSTYVIPGHVISASGPEFVSEKIGRGREEKAKRRREERETDEMLHRLLGRDGGGDGDRNAAAGAVRKAREVMKTLKGDKDAKVTKKGKNCRKVAYSAEAIKRLGFDPVVKFGREGTDGDVQRKVCSFAPYHVRPASAYRLVQVGHTCLAAEGMWRHHPATAPRETNPLRSVRS